MRDRAREPDTPPVPLSLAWRSVTALGRVLEGAERERARVLRDRLTPPGEKVRRVGLIADRVLEEFARLLKIGTEPPYARKVYRHVDDLVEDEEDGE